MKLSSTPAFSIALFLALLATPTLATTIRVPADQPNIQAGIDAASSGDLVLVAPGTYVGAGNKNLNFRGKAIAVRSESGAPATDIDCEGSGRGFAFIGGETSASVLDGFTIRRGFIDGMVDNTSGAAILILFASPTIMNCVFIENSATSGVTNGGGAAVSCQGSASEIRNCEFRDNTIGTSGPPVSGQGGGLADFGSSLTVIDCLFEHNRSMSGAGGGAYSYPFVDDQPRGSKTSYQGCTFNNNQARDGGGLVLLGQATVTNSTFTNNHGSRLGGGIFGGTGCTVEDCVMTGNSAGAGGGVYLEDAAMTRCVLVGNAAVLHGGGLFGNPLTVTSCTLVDNSAPLGSSVSSQGVTIANSILAFGGPSPAVDCRAGPTTVVCSDIYGHSGGDWVGCIESQLGTNSNITLDPQFCSRPLDLHLCIDSPCAPGQTGECGLIGARDVGCSVCGATAVEPATWGRIKAGADRIR